MDSKSQVDEFEAWLENEGALVEEASSVDGFSGNDALKAIALCVAFIAGVLLLVWAGNHYHWWNA